MPKLFYPLHKPSARRYLLLVVSSKLLRMDCFMCYKKWMWVFIQSAMIFMDLWFTAIRQKPRGHQKPREETRANSTRRGYISLYSNPCAKWVPGNVYQVRQISPMRQLTDVWLHTSELEKLLCRIEDRKKQLSPRDLVSDWLVQEIDGYAKEMDILLSCYLVIFFSPLLVI